MIVSLCFMSTWFGTKLVTQILMSRWERKMVILILVESVNSAVETIKFVGNNFSWGFCHRVRILIYLNEWRFAWLRVDDDFSFGSTLQKETLSLSLIHEGRCNCICIYARNKSNIGREWDLGTEGIVTNSRVVCVCVCLCVSIWKRHETSHRVGEKEYSLIKWN